MDRDPKKLKATQWPFKLVADKKAYIVMVESEKGGVPLLAARRWTHSPGPLLPVLEMLTRCLSPELNGWVESINAAKQQSAEALAQIPARVAETINDTQKAQLVAFRQRVFATDLTDEEKEVCATIIAPRMDLVLLTAVLRVVV